MHESDLQKCIAKGLPFALEEKISTSIMKGFLDEIEKLSFTMTNKIISGRFRLPKVRISITCFSKSYDSCQESKPSKQIDLSRNSSAEKMFHT